MQFEQALFQAVVDHQLQNANAAWTGRVEKAVRMLATLPWLYWDAETETLTIVNEEGVQYEATASTCKRVEGDELCPAFADGRACYHRAMAVLVRNYHRKLAERQALHDTIARWRREIPLVLDGKLVGVAETEDEAEQWYARAERSLLFA